MLEGGVRMKVRGLVRILALCAPLPTGEKVQGTRARTKAQVMRRDRTEEKPFPRNRRSFLPLRTKQNTQKIK